MLAEWLCESARALRNETCHPRAMTPSASPDPHESQATREDESVPGGERRVSPARLRLRQSLPWLIAAAIFYYLFNEVPIADAWAAARAARLELFLPAVMGAVFLWFLIDSAVFAFLFSRFNAKLDWAEARSLRGLTYLVTPINWNLGTAAVILHLRTSKRIAALDSTSTMVFYQFVDGLVLAAFVALGAALLPASPAAESMRNIAATCVVVIGGSLALVMGSWPRARWIEHFRSLRIFSSHRAANARDVFLLMLMKGAYFSVFVGVYWGGCRSFGVDVPLQLALAATPAIMAVSTLPITPAGFGTQQAAMLYFFGPYGGDAAILAFGVTFPVALILFRVLVGLPYLKDLPKLRRSMAEERAAS